MEHICVWCGRSFRDERKMRRHEQTLHFTARFPCGLCSSTFTNTNSRRRHAMVVHGLSPTSHTYKLAIASGANVPTTVCPLPKTSSTVEFPCQLCNTTFPSQPVFIDHMVEFHNYERSNAELITKPIMQNALLPPVRRAPKKFKCRICALVFSSNSIRNQHLIDVHGFKRGWWIDGRQRSNKPLVINEPILQNTWQQNQTYQPLNIPANNFIQGGGECHYDVGPTVINAPIWQESAPMQQNQMYRPPAIPVENFHQASNIQTPYTLNGVPHQDVNSLNVLNNNLNSTFPDHGLIQRPCTLNSVPHQDANSLNVLNNDLNNTVPDYGLGNSTIHAEQISPYTSNSSNIQRSTALNNVPCQDANPCVLNNNLNNTIPNHGLEISTVHTEQISPYTSNCSVTRTESKPTKCPVCNEALFDENVYEQHIQSAEHKSAYEINFKDRIDFESNAIFSSCISNTVDQFFSAISNDFNILLKHLLLLNKAMIIDFSFMSLFCDKLDDDNIVISKYFAVQNEELTMDTDVLLLYDHVGKSFMSQYDNLLNLNPGWVLEEIVSLEIILKKPESDMQILSFAKCSSKTNKTGSPKKAKPLQLSKCKICKLYLVQENHEQHIDIISHRIAMFYLNNEKIKVNPDIDSLPDCFLNFRFNPENQMSINVFLSSIEFELLRLIYRVLDFRQNSSIKVDLRLFAIFNNSSSTQNEINNLGSVETFTIMNEVIHSYTTLPTWYQNMITIFESSHQMFVRNNVMKGQPCSLTCVLYLEIDFYETTISR